MNDELPEGWARVPASDLFKWSSGKFLPKTKQESGTIPVFGGNGIAGTHSEALVMSPTLVVGRVGALCGNVYRTDGPAWITDNAIYATALPRDFDLEYCRLVFAQAALGTQAGGSGQPFVNQDMLNSVEFPTPPAREQHRIVAQIEALVTKVRSSQERLDKILGKLRRFRQAVLTAACNGTLTVDWRQEHPDEQSGSDTARQIDAMRANVARSSKDREGARTRAEYARVEVLPEQEWPDEMAPDTWAWVRFGSVIGELRNGVSPRPNIDPPGTPILRISAARPGSVDLSDIRYMPAGKEFLPTFTLRDNDLLFTRYNGSIELLGVCGMVRGLGQRVLLYPDKLMRVRFDHELVMPNYAELFFQSGNVHDRVVAKSKSSAGQNGISGGDVKSQPFALPPVAEQREIVRRVESLFALTHRLESRHAKAMQQVERLTQSVLAKAFRGELVPTEAEVARRERRSYQTAEELLERITEAQARASKNGGTKHSGARRHARR